MDMDKLNSSTVRKKVTLQEAYFLAQRINFSSKVNVGKSVSGDRNRAFVRYYANISRCYDDQLQLSSTSLTGLIEEIKKHIKEKEHA